MAWAKRASYPTCLAAVCVAFWCLLPTACSRSTPLPPPTMPALQAQADQPLDAAPFGQVMHWAADGKDYGVMWEDARDVFRVVVTFADVAPSPAGVRLQYWQSSWPQRRIPRDRLSGSGSSGWLDVGDWFQGKWMNADANVQADGKTWTYTFNPVNAKEFKNVGGFDARYRSTMKLRLVGDTPLPKITSLAAYTDSIYKPLDLEIEWGGNAQSEQVWDGRLEVFNGTAMTITPLSRRVTPLVGSDLRSGWKSRVRNRTDGIAVRILYTQPQGYNSFDETVITARTAQEIFSFLASDLNKYGHIFLPDYGVVIRRAGDATTYAAAYEGWERAKANPATTDLYTRVFQMPEQTFTRAWHDTPAKAPHYIPLSFEGGRQHFGLDEHGNVFCIKNWIQGIKGKDTARCKWEGEQINYRFGLPGSRPTQRGIVDGCLPMITAEWVDSGVRYRQTAFVVPLDGVPASGQRIHADDTLVLLARFEMEGAAPGAEAHLRFSTNYGNTDEKLVAEGNLLVAARSKTPRMLFSSPDPAGSYTLENGNGGNLNYRAKLSSTDKVRVVEVAIPYITPGESEMTRLRSIRFADAFAGVRDYWRSRVAAGTQITTPEPMINDFYRAHVSHLLINTEREVGNSDCYMPKVGTFHYGVYSNESCMMVSDLDRRGYNKVAERALETWLHYQGTVALPGDFSSKDGIFYGAGGYEHGEYNQHHGWVLWCMGEHYWYTRDKAWMDHAAPGIVKACQWVINQRQRTIDEAQRTPIRAIERGLLPPGRLEDIGDWRSWLSTNVFTWWGMDNAARALAAAGHPDGQRLVAQANAYRHDLLAAYLEAMHRSPVVRLRDGSWIPKIPSDVHRRGRSFGWITETLEGSIHLVRCGAIDPQDRLATWIIKDFEDNLYLSEQFGYKLDEKEFERRWFSHGGVSQQANLLHNSIPYLFRDEVGHFLRAYFNAFAVSYFADTRMMTEHALPEIGDWRGDHYKSSDEAQSAYWLRLMFVQEYGDQLVLGGAIPRYWLADGKKIGISNAQTYFGPMSMRMESFAKEGRIQMTIEPPVRNAPKTVLARFRHPDGRQMVRCEVNGKSYGRFDPAREWVDLGSLSGPVTVTAYYEK